jgi:hypothetical protein
MNDQHSNSTFPVEESASDRRHLLKVLGGASALGVAGLVGRPLQADAALVNIVIVDVLNDLSITIPIKNNNIAVQVCAAVDILSTDLLGIPLTCEVVQQQ